MLPLTNHKGIEKRKERLFTTLFQSISPNQQQIHTSNQQMKKERRRETSTYMPPVLPT